MSLSIDGSSSAAISTSALTGNVTLSTTLPNDIVIVIITIANLLGQTVTGITDSAGLTYTKRASKANGIVVNTEEWYAKSSGILTNDTITVTLNAGAQFNIIAFAVNGAVFANPFDPNTSVPATDSGISNTPTVGFNTTNPNDLIFAAIGISAALSPTPGTGYTSIQTSSNILLNPRTGFSEYKTVTSAGNQTASCTLLNPSTWVIIADSLTSDAVSSGKSSITTRADLSSGGKLDLEESIRSNATLKASSSLSGSNLIEIRADIQSPGKVDLETSIISLATTTSSTSTSGLNCSISFSVSLSVKQPPPVYTLPPDIVGAMLNIINIQIGQIANLLIRGYPFVPIIKR